MRKRIAQLAGVVAAGVAFAACTDTSPVTPPGLDDESTPLFGAGNLPAGATPDTRDSRLVRIAQEVPGFAGFYYAPDGALEVVMAGTPTISAAELSRSLAQSLAAMGVDAAAQPMRVVPGEYDFAQLDAMHRSVATLLSMAGVVYTSADEVANRVRIGVEDAGVAARVEHALGMLGLPAGAVIITETEPIETLQTLQSRVRPIGGGLQIWRFIPPGQASICTLGFNVRAPARPNVQGFVTNSHCTEQRGVVTGTEYNQKELALPLEIIGVEVHDPPFFQGGECPVGRNCRYSDAAGVQYNEGVDQAFGQIYRTTAPSQHTPGPLTIDPNNPRWTITSETPFPTVGMEAHKTGRTTGWLIGPVIETCINTNVSGAGAITMLCQDRVEATAAGGDSGSPVFLRDGETSNVSLVGILWGGSANTYVFSAMDNIRFENPGPVGWTVYPGQTPPQ